MTKQYTCLLFFMIYSIIGIVVPAMQFSLVDNAYEIGQGLPVSEGENPQQGSELPGLEEESEFCHRLSFPPHQVRQVLVAADLLCFAPAPGTCNPSGDIYTPPPKFI